MNTLILPVVEYVVEEDEVLVYYRLPGATIDVLSVTPQQFQACYREAAVVPAPRESKAERHARQLAEVRARFGDSDNRVSVAKPADDDFEADPGEEAILRLGLTIKADPLKAIIKVNNEAGRDGSDLTLAEAKELNDIINSNASVGLRQAAFRRIATLPLVKLYRIRGVLSDDLAKQIALERCKTLGQDRSGLGSSYMPADWGGFVSGQLRTAEELAEAVTDVPASRPPEENFSFKEGAEEALAASNVTLDAVENRWANMTIHATEPVK